MSLMVSKRVWIRRAAFLAIAVYAFASIFLFFGSKPDEAQSKRLEYIRNIQNASRSTSIFVASAKIDRHSPLESARLVASELLSLAFRTRRRIVFPPVLGGSVIRPNQYHDIPKEALRLVPDLFEVSDNAKQSGIENFLAPPSLWTTSKSKLFIIHILCSGNICGEKNAAYDCGVKLDLFLNLVAAGGPLVVKTTCIVISDYNTHFLEDIIIKEAFGMDVLLHNFHSNLMLPSTLVVRDEEDTRVIGHLRIEQIMSIASPRRLQAERIAEQIIQKDFIIVYYHVGWSLTASEEKIVARQFSDWFLRRYQSLPRETILIMPHQHLEKSIPGHGNGPEQLDVALGALSGKGFEVRQPGDFKALSNDEFRTLEYLLLTSSSCKSVLVLSDPIEPYLAPIIRQRSSGDSKMDFIANLRIPEAATTKAPRRDLPVAFFVITVDRLHRETVQQIVSTWAKEYQEHVFFISDTSSDAIGSSNVRIPNLIDSGCAANMEEGLWCKNDFIFKYIQGNTKLFRDYKWFSRIDDETLIVVPNLVQYLQQQDHTKVSLIGEKYCHQLGFSFASGGPGFIFSRAFVENFDWDLWTQIPLTRLPFYTDDIVTGYYCAKTRGCTLIHHPGFSNAAAGTERNLVYPWLLSKSGDWNLPFRPVAYHQRKAAVKRMGLILNEISKISYDMKSKTIQLPECKCFPEKFGRCSSTQDLAQHTDCKYDAVSPSCILGRDID